MLLVIFVKVKGTKRTKNDQKWEHQLTHQFSLLVSNKKTRRRNSPAVSHRTLQSHRPHHDSMHGRESGSVPGQQCPKDAAVHVVESNVKHSRYRYYRADLTHFILSADVTVLHVQIKQTCLVPWGLRSFAETLDYVLSRCVIIRLISFHLTLTFCPCTTRSWE